MLPLSGSNKRDAGSIQGEPEIYRGVTARNTSYQDIDSFFSSLESYYSAGLFLFRFFVTFRVCLIQDAKKIQENQPSSRIKHIQTHIRAFQVIFPTRLVKFYETPYISVPSHRPRLLITSHNTLVLNSLLHVFEDVPLHTLSLSSLYDPNYRTPEEAATTVSSYHGY